MKKRYTNFKEIDRDLKILKLQTEIDKEEVKMSIDQVKANMSPASLVSSLFGSVVQRALVMKAASKIFGLKKLVSSK